MPKIKLSALASDIKGKANGSVFSTNSGGTYFRNNPSGGGRKSPKWDLQKNNFGSLATQWKALTQTQQEAWQDATVLYPTVNAFGDPRIPSGYELFMRLNGSLSAVGLPLLSVPKSPRSVVPYGSVDIDYPTLWQLNPNYAVQTYNNNLFAEPRYITAEQPLPTTNLFVNYLVSLRIIFPISATYPLSIPDQIPLLSSIQDSTHFVKIYLQIDKELGPLIYMEAKGDSGNVKVVSSITLTQLQEGFHLGAFFGSASITDTYLTINGIITGAIESYSGNNTNIRPSKTWYVGNNLAIHQSYFAFNDLKFFTQDLTTLELKQNSQGYILGFEWQHWGATETTELSLTNYGNDIAKPYLELSSHSHNGTNGISVLYPLIPNFDLLIPNEPDEDMYLNIYASPPISNGITGSFNNFKLICTLPWTGQGTYSVHEYYIQVFGNVPANSSVLFRVQWVDATTGAKAQIATRAKPKKPRFKGATDLTDTVN